MRREQTIRGLGNTCGSSFSNHNSCSSVHQKTIPFIFDRVLKDVFSLFQIMCVHQPRNKKPSETEVTPHPSTVDTTKSKRLFWNTWKDWKDTKRENSLAPNVGHSGCYIVLAKLKKRISMVKRVEHCSTAGMWRECSLDETEGGLMIVLSFAQRASLSSISVFVSYWADSRL